MKAVALQLDDRREIWKLLDRLTPASRVDFLKWCCRRVIAQGSPLGVQVTTHSGTTNETYYDLCCLEYQYRLNLMVACDELVRRVREI